MCEQINEEMGLDFELGEEEVVESWIQLSMASALKGPDSKNWLVAITREKTKLLAQDTWRALNDEELKKYKQVVPICVILSRKRDRSYKARACVLGNQISPTGLEVFASAVSQCGNRYLLAAATSAGEHIRAFDIDCAFLNAHVEEEVYVRLPPEWREANDSGVKRLVKALYGLRQAPRAWQKRYEKELTKLGWEACPQEPGLWRKQSKTMPGRYLKLSVYVDDNLITSPCKWELDEEMQRILKVFPGRLIEPEDLGNGWLRWDILGSDLHYNRGLRTMRINMARYIQKVLKKFNLESAKPANSPGFDEASLLEEKNEVQFPYRELVGCLQWAATVARPDVSQPVSALSRYSGKMVTKARVTAAKKVLRYLKGTAEDGLFYSPDSEKEFQKTYGDLLVANEGESAPEGVTKFNLFSDASFANCAVTFKSTSGSILYYKSVPIIWKCSRQTVRAYSTSEAEYIAASDALVLTQGVGFADFFSPVEGDGLEECPLWVDNQSAIQVAKAADVKPRSRHYALRYLRVRDSARRLQFCPTNLMKADGLTKVECSKEQRRLLLHHTYNPAACRDDEEEEEAEDFGAVFLTACYPSFLD